MKLILKLLVLGLLSVGTTFAQTYSGSEASRIIENSERIVIDPTDGTVQFCSFQNPIAFDEKAVDQMKQSLGFQSDFELEEVGSHSDKLGFTHVKYEQTYNGIPVEGAVISFHVKGGDVISFSGDYQKSLQISTSPVLLESEALEIARTAVKSDSFLESDSPELKIFTKNSETFLTYKVDVFGQAPVERKFVFVDAQLGDIVGTYQRIHEVEAEGEAETLYSGARMIHTDSTAAGFKLNDYSRGDGIITYDMNGSTFYGSATEIVDSDNFWQESDHSADAALDAHWGTEVTYDYFLNVHGRDSYDGEGASINSYVDYDFSYSNAFWNGEAMTYGAGGFGDNPFPAIDVVAHEIVHGLTEHSAGLIYAYESGALNESFSDIFGIAVDFAARGEEYANYEMAEDIRTPPIRSMSNPNLLDCPDTYQGDFWVFGGFDNGGVHFNSGVQNFWFYLLAEGGNGTNDNGDDYSVQSIGLEAAAAIAFRNLTVYLSPNSQFADARTFSIQSAIDLYGECSDEVVAVTNAWQAVGVGEVFDNAVIAGFDYSNNYYCQVPATIGFNNLSSNASEYLWSFGDGNTSTEENPSHTYTSVGEYTVTLEVSGDTECSNGDTLELIDLITVTDEGGPLSPTCTPLPTIPNVLSGISSFELVEIVNSSGAASEGYEDFTCTHSTELTEGTFQTLTAELFDNAYLHVWIDLNADGGFTTDEKIGGAAILSNYHEFDFIVPGGSLQGVPLRLRAIASSTPNAESCNIGQFGQAEDYTVILLENEAPPVAAFSVEGQSLQPSETIQFNDFSLNLPDTWEWYFEGGSPETSTEQYPNVQYSSEGTFDVELIVANAFGSDTLLMTEYISVVSSINMCEENSTTAISGLLYDSGGPEGNYSNGEFCTLLISPGCAQSITLSFEQFQLEGCCDYFRVYDGMDASAEQIMNENGFGIPPDVTADSGNMFIQFSSDGSVTYSGWSATWTSETPTDNPLAEFTISDDNPPLNQSVQFSDASTNFPATWLWDFGDGSTSTEQNPVHAFTSPGIYEVEMVVGNCFGYDTTSTELTVQAAPAFELVPSDSLALSLNCGSTADTIFYIINNGVGDLVVSSSINSMTPDGLRILALTTYTTGGIQYGNILNVIDDNIADYTLTESNALSSLELTEALQDVDIFLIPRQNTFNEASYFSTISPAVVSFVEGGGSLLVCGNNAVGHLGVFPIADEYESAFFDISVINSDYSITDNVELSFSAPPATITHVWAESIEVEPIIVFTDFPNYYVVAKQNLGEGTAIYCGFDYANIAANFDVLLANSLEYLSQFSTNGQLVDSISLAEQEIITPGDSLEVFFSVNAEGVFAGNYIETLHFQTNDPTHPLDSLQIQLEVIGQPLLTVQPDIIDFGELIAGFSSTDTVFVFNDGCAELELNLSIDNAVFSLSGENDITVPPFSADTLLISFSSEIVGSYSGNLSLSSNGGETSVQLIGESSPAPEIEIIPSDTLFVTVPCGGVSEDVFTIANNGGSNLEVNVNFSTDGELNILALTTYTDFNVEYPNTLDALESYFDDYILDEFGGTDIVQLAELLEETDIFLIPEQEGSITSSFYTTISSTVLTYIENGGQVLICGSDYVQNIGIFPSDFSDFSNGGQITSTLPSHPILEGIPSSFSAPNATFCQGFSAESGVISIAEYIGLTPIFEFELGSGRMVYLGFDFFDYEDVHAQILGNSMNYLSTYSSGGILFDTEFPLDIEDSESADITVTTDAEGMLAGQYYTDIIFQTNDPDNAIVTYVIATEVTGDPLPAISSEEIVFASIFNGQIAMDTLIVSNDGCETLTVDAALPDGFFSISTSVLTVEPFSSDTIIVTYAPLQSGAHTDVIELVTNAGSFSVVLSGAAAGAPTIVVTPENPSVDVTACADSVLVTFDVSNTGEALLEFSIGSQTARSLDDVLLDLNENYEEITNLISDIYFFSGGEFGNSISDGGGDMYDGGNYLNTDLESFIPYTTGTIVESTAFGENSNYFTRKVPGLFVLAADISEVDLFRISGNLGADGSGANQGGDLSHFYGGVDYRGFYTSTFSTNDPTINHLIIVEDNPSLDHAFLSTTSSEDHSVSGLSNSTRIYYLLFAGTSFSTTEVSTMQSILATFVEDFAAELAVESDASYQVESGESTQVDIYVPVSGLDEGTYEFQIQFLSNAPGNPQLTVPVTINVDNTPCAFFEAIVDEGTCSGLVDFENQSTNSPDSFVWDFGDGNTSTEENPLHGYAEPGLYTVSLTVCIDDDCNSFEQTVEIDATGGPVAAACQPEVFDFNFDIYLLQNSINGVVSPFGQGGDAVEDQSCEVFTELLVGEENTFEVIYFSEFPSTFVRAEIDFNSDGIFTFDELIFDGFSSNSVETSFVVPPGTVLNQPLRYRLIISNSFVNDCSLSMGRVRDLSIVVSPVTEVPESEFEWAVLDECQRVYQFTDNSTNLPTAWSWNFGDGTTSSLQNPIHIFEEGGDYEVSLESSNIFGSTVYQEFIEAQESGISSIDIVGNATVGEPISFSVIYDEAGTFTWDFGDGASFLTTLSEVEHTYSASGIFEVSVSTNADVCNNEFSTILNILPLGVADRTDDIGFKVFPNPSKGDLIIESPDRTSLVDVTLYDAVGRRINVIRQKVNEHQVKLKIEDPVAGMYFLLLTTIDGDVFRSRVVLE